MFDALKFKEKNMQEMWRNFFWHDLGADVVARTPLQPTKNLELYRRLKNGKSRMRVILKRRQKDDFYGSIQSFLARSQDAERVNDFPGIEL
jgi:hypothetical protein